MILNVLNVNRLGRFQLTRHYFKSTFGLPTLNRFKNVFKSYVWIYRHQEQEYSNINSYDVHLKV